MSRWQPFPSTQLPSFTSHLTICMSKPTTSYTTDLSPPFVANKLEVLQVRLGEVDSGGTEEDHILWHALLVGKKPSQACTNSGLSNNIILGHLTT